MKKILDYIKKEPAVLSTAVSALITLAAAFGLNLSAEQTGAIGAVVALVAGLITRSVVTSNANLTTGPTAVKD